VLENGRNVFAPLRFQKLFQRLFDTQKSQVSPHQLVELAQARVGAGIGGSQEIIGTGGFDVAAHLDETGVTLAPFRRKRTEQSLTTLDELRHLLGFTGAFGRVLAPVHPTVEEREIGQVDPSQNVSRNAYDQAKQLSAKKAHAKRQEPQCGMVRALQKFGAIV